MSFTSAVVAKVFRFFKWALSGKVPLTITVVAKVGCPWGYKNFFDLSRFNRFHLFRNNFKGLCHDTFHISTLVVWGEDFVTIPALLGSSSLHNIFNHNVFH